MKLKSLFFMSLSMALVLFNACSPEDTAVSGITLDETSLSFGVGDTAALKATLAPKGASGTIAWSSSNTAVATVSSKGVITALEIGTTTITATVETFTATCAVTITERTNFTHSLQGSAYYPIILDSVSAKTIQSKIVADLRPDESTKFLYVWNGTFSPGTCTGPNAYGEVEDWVSLIVGSQGWSGGGFFVQNSDVLDKLVDVTTHPQNYFLHMVIRSRNQTVYLIALDGQSTGKIAIGATGFNDNGNITPAVTDFTRDGEWHEIEIPMTTFTTNGLLYTTGMTGKNVMWFLAGGVSGATMDMDAVFIYKK
jgi:hypothetical protein